jgi:uncharacterized protein
MIIETIFSTLDQKGNPNFAPMGLEWGEEFVTVRPFCETQTFRNLLSTGYGVANITDDVLAYVRCALYDAVLPHSPAMAGPGVFFSSTCSWREMEIVAQAVTGERAEFRCRIVHEGRQRDFLGFCRAGNAVIEATILATRLRHCDPKTLAGMMALYKEIIEKTGDNPEKQAFQMVHAYVQRGT